MFAKYLGMKCYAICQFLSNGQQKAIKMHISTQTKQICQNVNKCWFYAVDTQASQ